MNKYTIITTLLCALMCTWTQPQEPRKDVYKQKAYNIFYELFDKTTADETFSLNMLGQMYKELPITSRYDERVKENIRKQFQEKFGKSIDDFPLRIKGFFDTNKYFKITESILKETLKAVSQALNRAQKTPPTQAQEIIKGAFIALADAYFSYKSLAQAKPELADQARQQLDALRTQYAFLNPIATRIEDTFNKFYHPKYEVIRHIALAPVGELGEQILSSADNLMDHFTNQQLPFTALTINSAKLMPELLNLAFLVTQYQALKKTNPSIADERLESTILPLLDFLESSLTAQQQRDILDTTSKSLAEGIKGNMQPTRTVCYQGECQEIKSTYAHLVYYLVRYATLQRNVDTALIRQALAHLSTRIQQQTGASQEEKAVPFVNVFESTLLRGIPVH